MPQFIILTWWTGLESQSVVPVSPPPPQEWYLVKMWYLHFSEWWFPLLVYCHAFFKSPTQMASCIAFSNTCAVTASKKVLQGRQADRRSLHAAWPWSAPQPQGHGGHLWLHHSIKGLFHPHCPELQETHCVSLWGGAHSDQGTIGPRVAWYSSSQHCSFQYTWVIALLRPTYP